MVENPEERFPRATATVIAISGGLVLGSLGLARWYAQTVMIDADSLVIVGWAIGAGAILAMNRLVRWLDEHEATVARLERRLGGDA